MKSKGYTIGFSSGMFYIVDQNEKQNFLTMPRKMFRGALEGVTFTQIDIESITEFKEPYLKEGINRMKRIGLRFGFHGESYAMGGGEKPMGMLDSCIEPDYIHSHMRLIQHIQGCGELGGEFVNVHPSETTPYIRLAKDMQPAKLVDPWGRPFSEFVRDNPKLFEWVFDSIMKQKNVITAPRLDAYADRAYTILHRKRDNEKPNEKITKEDEAKIVRRAYELGFYEYVDSSDLEYGAEKVAYIIVAKWMQMNNDPLWKDIVGKTIHDEEYEIRNAEWVPAVSSKYIAGHFSPRNSKFQDPKPLLEKYKIYFVFETQMGSSGVEGLFRLANPSHMVLLCRSINCKWVGVCYDFEHVLSQNVKPKDDIANMADGMASYVKVCHLGWPTPHVPAHMPIPLGSEAQLYLYERLMELRKKGMKDAFFIFERASAGRESTIIALRMIKEYLEKDVEPNDLPLKFFGMDDDCPDIRRQQVVINEHTFDPLKGMLHFPEEEYTFLSKAATEKGKAELWKKEEYR